MPYVTTEIQDRTAVVRLDQPGEKVNTLTESLIDEFGRLFEKIAGKQNVDSVILVSGKDSGFIAGADLKLLNEFRTPEEVDEFNKRGNEILDKIAGFEKPVIAAINGACLGGGLEVALACDYRIATTDTDTKFGAPEVKLGLLPGGGGTQRLPRLIGLANSLDMLLTGKNVYPRQALHLGLVDEVVDKTQLLDAALNQAKRLSGLDKKNPLKKRKHSSRILEETTLGRKLIYSKARQSVQEKTHGNYPAPLKIIHCVETGIEEGCRPGRALEARYFTELLFTPQARQLIRLFFASRTAEKNPIKGKIKTVHKIGVVGAGLMGSGIADVSLREAGLQVYLKDRDLETTGRGMKSIWHDLDNRISKHIITSFDADRIMSRLIPVNTYADLKRANLIIEAVFEDLDIKHTVINEIESIVGDECVIASNTSSLPIHQIAEHAVHKERILGMHYFSPVPKMPLLEIIRTGETAEWAVATAYETGLRQGKTVILVNDGPGFYTTRILAPYMNEALTLLGEGASIENVDEALAGFGFPVGPFKLMDEVGLDIAAHVTDVLGPVLKQRGIGGNNIARKILDEGFSGRKNGKGFYTYDGDKRKGPNEKIYTFFDIDKPKKITPSEIRDRITLMMVNEAVICLQEGILNRPADGDLGAVFGLGFPPFLGGPFRYLDSTGHDSAISLMEHYRNKYGSRFEPAGLLMDQAKKKKKFYKDNA